MIDTTTTSYQTPRDNRWGEGWICSPESTSDLEEVIRLHWLSEGSLSALWIEFGGWEAVEPCGKSTFSDEEVISKYEEMTKKFPQSDCGNYAMIPIHLPDGVGEEDWEDEYLVIGGRLEKVIVKIGDAYFRRLPLYAE